LLDRLISSRARIELLKMLLLNTDSRFYLRELVARTGLPQGSVQRELANLVQAGVLVREHSGRQTYYSADDRCPILSELRSILVKTVGVADVLRDALAPLADGIEMGFIYGSLAKGCETAQSDVDVMLIGEIDFGDVVTALTPIEDQLRREINPSVFTSAEFKRRIETQEHFISSVLRAPRIMLIGDENELATVA
jgi:uncharacterized protein